MTIKTKGPEKLAKVDVFHENNSPTHMSFVSMTAAHECGFELIDQPPYSPDLTPSNNRLFSKLEQRNT